ncbi:MAG: hypothetical protein P8077_03340 [Gammaproteobacteria bacterium]
MNTKINFSEFSNISRRHSGLCRTKFSALQQCRHVLSSAFLKGVPLMMAVALSACDAVDFAPDQFDAVLDAVESVSGIAPGAPTGSSPVFGSPTPPAAAPIVATASVVEFMQASSTTSEGVDTHTVMVRVSPPQPVALSILIDVVDSGETEAAAPEEDYVIPNQVVNVPAGATQASVMIQMVKDERFEDPEMLKLAIGRLPSNLSMGANATHEVQIIDDDTPTEEDALRNVPRGAEQLKIVCDRMASQGINNQVVIAFCGDTPLTLTGIKDLQAALNLSFNANNGGNGRNGNPRFAITGHSSSLVMQFTNPINPRAVIASPGNTRGTGPFTAMGFVRGEQFAEIISAHFNPDDPNDPKNGDLEFFLLNFEQACNATESCTKGDLLTESIEKNWTGYTLFHEEDLKNTVLDCRLCHQSGGPTTAKSMLMQELNNPWTHWFRSNRPAGNALMQTFMDTHAADTQFAGMPLYFVQNSDPARLEDVLANNGFGNGFDTNTNRGRFNTRTIENEVTNSAPAQPADNTVPGVSQEWQDLFQRNVNGEIIQIPYHDAFVTDPEKLTSMSTAYQQYTAGQITDLPDIRQAFKDDEQLREIGFRVAAGLDGRGIMVQACTQCHNQNLDQTISRAKLDVNLDLISIEEIQVAIERINLEEEHLRVMPPRRFRFLDAVERQTLTEFFKAAIQAKQAAAAAAAAAQ